MSQKKAEFSDYEASADFIRSNTGKIDAAVILGTGLDRYAENIIDPVTIPYRDIPNFPVSTVKFQKGELVYGSLSGTDKKVLIMNGRFHYYEGWEMWQCAYPIGVFRLLDVDRMIITNAAGGISEDYKPGDLVCVRDHIKLTADSPLRGANLDGFNPVRYCDMQSVYDKTLAGLAHATAEKNGITLKDGVYAYMGGPQYETPAEIRMLRACGATLVGMSTVPEIIAAAHCGIRVLCLSCVTNMAAGITGAAINEQEVVDTGARIASGLRTLVTGVIAAM
jgi:purine-nucleoside phosphorylase